ncbi:MAG: 16S rRNA (guanine(966)-N(2))-methyltransferase RsmD [Pseudobdellovibrio sp.]
MRIISGKYKGRPLVSFKADHIRPTMDRVKETLFNKWMGHVEGARVLDLFAGTGNLGLEALSRHAAHVTFVEKNSKSITIIRENINLLKVTKDESLVIQKDVFSFLKLYANEGFDLIFIDPPFTEKIAHDVMQALSLSKCTKAETLIAIEAIKQERIDAEYGDLICYDKQDYGDKSLSLFSKKVED